MDLWMSKAPFALTQAPVRRAEPKAPAEQVSERT